MKLIIQRIIAIILLVVPGILAAYGIIAIRDVIFDYIAQSGEAAQAGEAVTTSFQWLKLLWGILCFAIGAGFIGGWIYFRDKKRNYVAPRFRKKPSK